MVRKSILLASGFLLAVASLYAQPKVTDLNTPLHLMRPDYKVPYGVPSKDDVRAVVDRVYKCVDEGTRIGKNAPKQIFRITGYEWGVTYSGMIALGNVCDDGKFADYVRSRHLHLAEGFANGTIRSLISPGALDDCGAITASMIKMLLKNPGMKSLRPVIDNCVGYIRNKEFRLADGTLARNRPLADAVWLDDMFMGIPALAWYGRLSGDKSYYEEAIRQVRLFAGKMWVPEKSLFRHGWIAAMDGHPAYHWGRANGWAVLTLSEVLDAVPEGFPGRDYVMDLFKKHVGGLAALQSGEGFWHQLLDRNDSYLETSATAIFAYCFAHGVNEGWLNALEYGPAAILAWNAVSTMVDEEGYVNGTCVGTGMGFDPAFYYYRPVSRMAAHGYGPALLAGAETIRLLETHFPKVNDSAVQFYDRDMSDKGAIFSVK